MLWVLCAISWERTCTFYIEQSSLFWFLLLFLLLLRRRWLLLRFILLMQGLTLTTISRFSGREALSNHGFIVIPGEVIRIIGFFHFLLIAAELKHGYLVQHGDSLLFLAARLQQSKRTRRAEMVDRSMAPAPSTEIESVVLSCACA